MTGPGVRAPAVTEPHLRFLRAIADRVAVERVAEVYLFPPMRQGLVESGVGVVAVLPEDAAADTGDGVDLAVMADEGVEPVASEGVWRDGASEAVLASEMPDAPRPAGADGGVASDADASAMVDQAAASGATPDATSDPTPDATGDATHDATASADATADDAAAGGPPQQQHAATDAEPADHFAADRPRTPRTGGRRSTIYSARYRLTLKGPDRGKWEVEVRAEADAPLITVDAVIRGIQRRAPGEADAERLTGDAFRELVAPPA